MEPSYDDALTGTIWSHWCESQRLEASVRRLLAAAEQCQEKLQATRRGELVTQQDAPSAAVSGMI